jgi:hypothetical protein
MSAADTDEDGFIEYDNGEFLKVGNMETETRAAFNCIRQ